MSEFLLNDCVEMDSDNSSSILLALTVIASVQTIGIFTVVILMGVFVHHYKRKNRARAATTSESTGETTAREDQLYATVQAKQTGRHTFEMKANKSYAVPLKWRRWKEMCNIYLIQLAIG